MIGRVQDETPVVLARFSSDGDAASAIDTLVAAGIPPACIDGPTPRTSAIAVKVPGRSDRYLVVDTCRELGATVQVVEPVTPF